MYGLRVTSAVACVLVGIGSAFAQEQIKEAKMSACPVEQGVYVSAGNDWKELPVEIARKENHTIGNLAHDNAVAYYAGAASTVEVSKDVVICVSGSPLGSTLLLAKAQEKKDERRVLVGTISMLTGFTFKIGGKQSVAFQQTRDKNRNYMIRASSPFESGQYMLFLQQGSSLSTVPPAFTFGVR